MFSLRFSIVYTNDFNITNGIGVYAIYHYLYFILNNILIKIIVINPILVLNLFNSYLCFNYCEQYFLNCHNSVGFTTLVLVEYLVHVLQTVFVVWTRIADTMPYRHFQLKWWPWFISTLTSRIKNKIR